MKIKKNLFENQFDKLAREEGIKVQKEYEPGYSKFITFMPGADYNEDLRVKSLSIDIPYKEQIISVKYEVGDVKQGKLKCSITRNYSMADFKVKINSNFTRLFLKNKNIIEVRSKNKKLKKLLEKNLLDTGLESIARNSQFQPEIKGTNIDGFEINTLFSLSFSDKEKVLEPLIQFYKNIIDLNNSQII